jgi:hypothetical protein
MLDSPPSLTDKPAANPEVHSKLRAAAEAPVGSKPKTSPTGSDTTVPSGSLPNLVIDTHEQTPAAKPSGIGAVFKELGTGAWNEITQHPGQVIESAGIGLGIGVLATLAAPEVGVAALGAGIGYGAYELYKHAGGWIDAAKTVADSKDHSAAQVAQANTELQGVGAGGVLLGAGIVGGIAGSDIAGIAAPSIVDTPPVSTPDPDSPPPVDGPGDIPVPKGQPGDVPAPAGPASATIPAEAHASPAATPPADTPTPAAQPADSPVATPPTDAPAKPVATPSADATGEKPAIGDAKPAAAAPLVDLDNPAANTNEAALSKAFQNAIQANKTDGQPLTFKVDDTVKLTDDAGNPVKTTQSQVLYKQLQEAYPDNQFVFSKPDLNPGDPGYTEIPAPAVTQDGLHISTKENPITLGSDTTLPDGTTLPAGSKFAVGTTYDGNVVKSALPDGKVWATKPDGSYVQVADAGGSTAVPPDAVSSEPLQSGQVANAKTPDGYQNHIIVRTDASATAPDGSPLLDAYPSGGPDFEAAYKEGSEPGKYAPKPKSADHFLLPKNVTVEANTKYGASTASGAKQDYFMKSGFADAQEATAKNYSGPTKDAQSAAELARIRGAQAPTTPASDTPPAVAVTGDAPAAEAPAAATPGDAQAPATDAKAPAPATSSGDPAEAPVPPFTLADTTMTLSNPAK